MGGHHLAGQGHGQRARDHGLALLPFLGLWLMMMAAMMLPSVAPVAVLWTWLITAASPGLGLLRG
jgi:predicted metal-binding membrane protein